MDRKIIVTEDNSKTLLIPSLNETYHSTKGAFNEAMHVFIAAGLSNLISKSVVNVFEMGFGTGLNALVSLDFGITNGININYTSIEKYPLSFETVKQLDYPSLLNTMDISTLHAEIHNSEWGKSVQIHPHFVLKKIEGDISDLKSNPNAFDIVFYDAFGPKIQPDLWSTTVLQKMSDLLKTGGVLVTYCAQGQFKRNLKSVGFVVENLPGPPGKREMTRAIKASE